jgi:rhodanese-related sulfurtransferase
VTETTAPADAASLSPDAILERARTRGRELGLPYAGAVTPTEAWALHRAGAAQFVDVRTAAEWEYVGRVPDSRLVEWRRFGEKQPNAQFVEQLAAVASPDKPVMFLCRSAARSHNAAAVATQAGYAVALNILEGFEGELDAQGHRGERNGWRFHNLPWVQG